MISPGHHNFFYNGSPVAKQRVRNVCDAFRPCFRGVFDSLPRVPRTVASRNGTRAHAVLGMAKRVSRAVPCHIYPSLGPHRACMFDPPPKRFGSIQVDVPLSGTCDSNARNDCPRGPKLLKSEPDPPSRLARIRVLIPFPYTHTCVLAHHDSCRRLGEPTVGRRD